ncbi:MAG: hypothetical protein NTV86_22095 [Planctomycetota bacterium]|nr:hypothetical protein [Planctomycetota bacterium]
MRKLALILVGAAGVLLGLGVLMAQPSDTPATRPAHQEGKNAPPGFRHLIPPFAAEKMNLTDDQRKQLDDLAKEVQAKLEKILTPEQMKILQDARPPRGERGPADRGGKGGQGERGGKGGHDGHDGPPPPPEGGQDGPPEQD